MGSMVPKRARHTFPKRGEEEGIGAVIPREQLNGVIASQFIFLHVTAAEADSVFGMEVRPGVHVYPQSGATSPPLEHGGSPRRSRYRSRRKVADEN